MEEFIYVSLAALLLVSAYIADETREAGGRKFFVAVSVHAATYFIAFAAFILFWVMG